MLVDPEDGRMVIPMHAAERYGSITSLQRISDSGEKKFLPGGRAKDAVFRLGRGEAEVLVEGFATALSVREGLRARYIKRDIVVCFSAVNLQSVARRYPRAWVIADHDASGTGQRAAEATGLPWAMPEQAGMDANDLHQQHGIEAVCDLIRRARER